MMIVPGPCRAEGSNASALDALHRPVLRVPASPSTGARVPISVELEHPMDLGHHITALEIADPLDPVPVKGVFRFTPASGRASVAFQARVHEGPSVVTATAHCGRHGRFTTVAPITVAAGGGGCVGGPPASPRLDDEIRGPIIHIPQLVADREIRAGEIVAVQVKIKHPNRTGLALRDGRFVQESEPFHLTEMDVIYAGERVSQFTLTAALSDSPMITCTLLARWKAELTVTLTNTRGQRFTATQPIRPV